MNSIDLCIIVIFLIIVFEGYARGFIASLLSLVRFAVGIPISFIVADKFSSVVYTDYFKETIRAEVLKGIENSGLDTYVASVKDAVHSLPDVLRGSVDLSFLDTASAASAADGIMSNIVDPVGNMIIKVALFVVTLAVFYILTGILLFVIKKLSNSSNAPFRKTNKFLGAVFGMLKALILVFAIAKIGSFFTENLKSVDNEFLHQLASSGIIEFVNNFNPIDF